ncbi:hypothetical protein PG989_000469 [Apiospora arundinis]
MEELDTLTGSAPMSYDVFCSENLNGYFPVDIKSEYSSPMVCDNDFDFTHVFGGPVHQPASLLEPRGPYDWQQYPSPDPVAQLSLIRTLSPRVVAQGYERFSIRPGIADSHAMDAHGIAAPSSMRFHRDMKADSPASDQRSNVKEVGYMDDAQISVAKIPKSVHVCSFPGCKNRTAYKRREHLQRHQNTKHGLGPEAECDFCGRKFNRKDNWMQHLRLHTEPNRPAARTNFHFGALLKYKEERSKIKPRKLPLTKQQLAEGDLSKPVTKSEACARGCGDRGPKNCVGGGCVNQQDLDASE